MPNGGVDNCRMCEFLTEPDSDTLSCELRGAAIEHPYTTYCANHPKNNPTKIQVVVGPIYVDAGEYPYRREVLEPSPLGSIEEKLELLERLVRGDLDTTSRFLQVELVKDIGESLVEEAIPLLVELVVAEPGDYTLIPVTYPVPDVFEIGDFSETRGVRTEFLRFAAMRALRRIWHGDGGAAVFDVLWSSRDSASPQQLLWMHVADRFISDYEEPP